MGVRSWLRQQTLFARYGKGEIALIGTGSEIAPAQMTSDQFGRWLSVASPEALERFGREGLQMRDQAQRMFEGARRNRLLQDLIAPTTSADAELRVSLRVLRDRAHMLVRDNPYARQAKRTTQINVVGPRGIQMQGQVLKANGTEKDTRRNQMLEEAWRRWCRADTCDVAGRLSFHGFEMMISGALPESGEALVRIVRQPMGQGRAPIALELIEAHQLDEDKSGVSERSGHEWRLGVELNQWGRPTRYAILTRHPGDVEMGLNRRDVQLKHTLVPAEDMIHVFLPERIGQNRGVPWLASVITTVHNLAEYEKSHWVRKRVQSNTLGWIVSKEGELIADKVENGQRLINTEPGAWNYLEPGEEPVAPDFGPDDGQYDAVVRNMTRRFAAGFGCSYSTISKDFSDANYSSMRTSVLEDRDHWRVVQSTIIEIFHQRVFEEWLRAAMLAGDLPSPAFSDYWTRPERYNAPRWQARSWDWVDPMKDMSAMEKAKAMLLKSHSELITEYSGEQFEQVMAQIAMENELKESLGLMPTVEEAPEPATPQPEPEDNDDQDNDDQPPVAPSVA
jgi:lambda family phage portal protein